MNCEQTRKNLPHLILKAHEQDSIAKGVSRGAFLQHLRACTACQSEYEALWQTATVLENLAAPIPPPELVENIQQRIRNLHKRRHVAFFANPIAWSLELLKLELSPKFVNAIALLCYLIATSFFVKLAFFTNPQETELGLTTMEKTRLRHVRISPASWALLKDTGPIARSPFQQETTIARPGINDFFDATLNSAEMWSTHAADTVKETVDTTFVGYPSSTASEKLTVFWSHIKMKL